MRQGMDTSWVLSQVSESAGTLHPEVSPRVENEMMSVVSRCALQQQCSHPLGPTQTWLSPSLEFLPVSHPIGLSIS